jgi:hypothetical protein
MCGCQELERRAHDKYDAFDRVNVEVHQLRERCSTFDALADALRTPDNWLAYRAMAWRNELPESSRQDPARRSSLERVCTALIDGGPFPRCTSRWSRVGESVGGTPPRGSPG